MSQQEKFRYRNLLTLYERFLLDPDKDSGRGRLRLDVYVSGKEGKSRVKEELMHELLELDKRTIKGRLDRSRRLVGERVRAARLVGAQVLVVDARLTYRGLFGSSEGIGEGLFEVGLTWDPVLDLPVIPGSSVKGAVRAFCEDLLASRSSNRDKAGKLCEALFGKPGEGGYVGLVVFADALPVEAGLRGGVIDADIINPHYNALTDNSLRMELDVMPVPVLHLCVGEGTVFKFLAYTPGRILTLGEDIVDGVEELAKVLGVRLPRALNVSAKAILLTSFLLGGALRTGIGARTLKGYGRFEVISCEVLTHA